jgi:hypothetical protein
MKRNELIAFIAGCALLSSCEKNQDNQKYKALSELAEHCRMPQESIYSLYRRATENENLRNKNLANNVVDLGSHVNDPIISSKSRCISELRSSNGYRFNINFMSPNVTSLKVIY